MFCCLGNYSIAENCAKIATLQAEISLYERNNKELKYLNDTLRDEHQALQLAFSSLEEKLRKTQVHVIFKYLFLGCIKGFITQRMLAEYHRRHVIKGRRRTIVQAPSFLIEICRFFYPNVIQYLPKIEN